MTEETDDTEFLGQLFEIANSRVRPDLLRAEHENVIRILQSCKPFDVPSACGALLLDKRWQANCVRLEALVHLAVLECGGKSQITATQLARCFNELGNGTCGRMEDPAEDVFVAQVLTPYGSLRVLEGIWEGGVFYLQQFVDLVIGMPTEGEWSELCDALFSMLKLSDAVCERAGLVPNEVGNPSPVEKLKPSDVSVEQPPLVVFRNDELQTLGISRAALDRFVLRNETPDRLATTPLLNSPLQRRPILADGERIALVVPTAVSYAIRVAVVEFLVARRMKTSLVSNLSRLYSRLIHKTHILGELDHVPLEFFQHDGLPVGEALCESESGVFVHLLCFMDSLRGSFKTQKVLNRVGKEVARESGRKEP